MSAVAELIGLMAKGDPEAQWQFANEMLIAHAEGMRSDEALICAELAARLAVKHGGPESRCLLLAVLLQRADWFAKNNEPQCAEEYSGLAANELHGIRLDGGPDALAIVCSAFEAAAAEGDEGAAIDANDLIANTTPEIAAHIRNAVPVITSRMTALKAKGFIKDGE